MPDKSTRSFISFDVVDFYPSISEELLKQALTFATQYDEITENEKHVIIQAKKSLLFNGNSTWCKKISNSLFDVTMGSFDGAETSELVGSYLLSKLTTEYGNDIGLYRDDGLAAFNKTPSEIENIKKHICKTFSDHSLKVVYSPFCACAKFVYVFVLIHKNVTAWSTRHSPERYFHCHGWLEDLEISQVEQFAALPNIDNINTCTCRGHYLQEKTRISVHVEVEITFA